LPGIITTINERDDTTKSLTINIEGNSLAKFDLVYPNKERIQACGEHLHDRDCETSRRTINKNKPVKIRFMPNSIKLSGSFLIDNGYIFGESGPYGWTKDISNRMKNFPRNYDTELGTLVEFPPSPKSKYCSKPSINTMCEVVSWSVLAGDGKFLVRIYAGDPNDPIYQNLKINDKIAVENEVIKDGDLKVYEFVEEAINKYITISPECEDNCDYALSKINAIEISPYKENEELHKEESQSDEKKVCGDSFVGGRCENGPDATHCLYDDPSKAGATNCNGGNMIIMIPKDYKCKDQVGKFKCVKKSYSSIDDCKRYCVQTCNKNKCIY